MTTVRTRREPPPFQPVRVVATKTLNPRMVRVTFDGAVQTTDPAASVRLLLPSPGTDELVLPSWNGNEFLLPDGARPHIRTFTPQPQGDHLDIDVVLHEGGHASAWAQRAQPGDPAAISGPGKGYEVDPDAPAYVLAGDETAIPAIRQLVDAIDAPTQVFVELTTPEARHDDIPATWVDDVVDAVRAAHIPDGARIWAAGEAAAMQQIRRHLFDERGIDRARTAISGYWKRR